jgi:hypothetical protein
VIGLRVASITLLIAEIGENRRLGGCMATDNLSLTAARDDVDEKAPFRLGFGHLVGAIVLGNLLTGLVVGILLLVWRALF